MDTTILAGHIVEEECKNMSSHAIDDPNKLVINIQQLSENRSQGIKENSAVFIEIVQNGTINGKIGILDESNKLVVGVPCKNFENSELSMDKVHNDTYCNDWINKLPESGNLTYSPNVAVQSMDVKSLTDNISDANESNLTSVSRQI